MAKKKEATHINPDLERVMSLLLQRVQSLDTMPVDEAVKILDRAIKIEELKKTADSGFGSGFEQ